MRYLITTDKNRPFLTNWLDYENNISEGMIVYDLHNYLFTVDGYNWLELEEDHL